MPGESRTLPAAAALLALVLFAVSANIVFAALVRASAEFGVRPEVLARVSAMQFAGFFVASIVGGLLADALGKKKVLQAGCLFVLAGAALWARAQVARTAFLAGFVMGVGGGILESVSSALLADLFPEKRKFYLNMSQVAYCVGAVGGPALMGRLLPAGVSWRWFFRATSVAALFLLGLFSLAQTPGPPPADLAGARPKSGRPGFSLVASCVVIFLYVLAEMGTVTFLAMYLQRTLQAPENWAIYGISVFWAAMVIGRILCAFIPEGHAYEVAIGALLLCAMCTMLGQAAINSWRLSVVCFGLTGLSFAGTWPLIVAMVASRHPHSSGAAVGVTVACGAVGCIAAPLLLGPLFAGPRPAIAFYVTAASLGIAFLVTMLLLAASRRGVTG